MNTLSTGMQRTSVWARGLAALGLVAGAWALSTAGTQAHARGDVYWSVGVNGPGVSIGASNAPVVVHQPPVYYQPPAYYYQPRPVVVQPAPVYYHRPPAVVYGPPVVYAPRPVVISGQGYWRERPGRWDDDRRGHRHGHRHDRDWDDDDRRGRGRH
jgi:hypothetical protein